MENSLHIITWNIPFPPDYGGIIDSFYRISALAKLGIAIDLHCFEYGSSRPVELESLCRSVTYYPRQTGFRATFSTIPYIVNSRTPEALLKNLLKNNHPILFDGLHTCGYLDHEGLKSRRKFVRVHNIEHQYYMNLSRAERNRARKIFYRTEAYKLRIYEEVLGKSEKLLAISSSDNEYFSKKYGNSLLINPFHQFDKPEVIAGSGNYILYHGDLSVNENLLMARYLASRIFSRVSCECIIAGRHPSHKFASDLSEYRNITLIPDPDDSRMRQLIKEAHINIIPSVSAAGFRLKLLSAMFLGRYCLANSNTVQGTGLEGQCIIAESAEGLILRINELLKEPFTKEMIYKREIALSRFDNVKNAEKIRDLIFPGVR